MHILRHIATALYKSVYDVSWLASQRYKLGRALGYFFTFFFVLLVLTGGFFVKKYQVPLQQHWHEFADSVPEFTVRLADGTLSIDGLEQPYRQVFYNEGREDSFLLYIDTMTTSSVTVEEARGDVEDPTLPVVVLTSKKLKVFDHALGEVHSEDLAKFPSFAVTKEYLRHKIYNIGSIIFPWIFVGVVIGSTLFLGVGKLVYLLLLTWIVYLLARADKKGWTYQQVFTVGLYALTVPILVQTILMNVFAFPIPYVYSMLALVYMFGAISKGGKHAPGAPTPPPVPPSSK